MADVHECVTAGVKSEHIAHLIGIAYYARHTLYVLPLLSSVINLMVLGDPKTMSQIRLPDMTCMHTRPVRLLWNRSHWENCPSCERQSDIYSSHRWRLA